jgi:hypothetical protein
MGGKIGKEWDEFEGFRGVSAANFISLRFRTPV